MRKNKRRSIQAENFLQGLMFFICTIGIIVCLIIYLWVFKEIDESLLAIEIQNTTARELKNEIDTIKNKVEKLSRSDLITARAKRELRMVTAEPETLIIAINKSKESDL
jgi:cell division protein FtsB